MAVITIQSQVAYGTVGNSAAVPILQMLGHETWPVPTVMLSNHTGYPDWAGHRFSAAQLRDMLSAIEARGAFADCEAVLTGYIGDPALVPVIADAIDRIRAANPAALIICDPVLGNDAKGLYVEQALVAAVGDGLLPRADILLPNRFELATIAGRVIDTVAQALDSADALAAQGPKTIVCKSIPEGEALVGILRTPAGNWPIRTPRLEVAANGAGDCFAAALLGRLLSGDTPESAFAGASATIHAILDKTRHSDRAEIPLATSRELIVNPPQPFPATRRP